ncbi:DUF899 family protein [Actinopolymorpha rutila]|uniref:Putative dithiol-disulfide oxidoreductase (DUF899 family) n=1 Tax=Actinopolymorpha rutila TaxID=446787 RepID=A0A852ZKJ6_9ACTN|nr:DUF899 family protein [Actinopolymorpha rutila]NYH93587.1 putative dithiol-disulfide oxidoreductase (DUF899 family) [Actinopolymorpha rutila]
MADGETRRQPGESDEYAAARAALAEAEHDLTRRIEAVAQLRRALPPGGRVPEDFVFSEGPRDIDDGDVAGDVRMSELFCGHESLLLYSFMYDGNGAGCRMCTSLIDGYDGAAPDLEQRVGFAVVAPAPFHALRAYGRERRWRNVRLVADPDASFSRAYGAVTADGDLRSLMHVFTRRDGSIRHFYTAEKPPSDKGQDDRHLDLSWSLWGALDLTPEGRGADWRPVRPTRS